MKIHQFNCLEGKNIDLRQANSVLKHKPDIIIREAPGTKHGAYLAFNPRESIKKQKNKLKKTIMNLQKVAEKYPWVISDIGIFKNATNLLSAGHKIKIFDVDAPSDLLKETFTNKWHLASKPRRKGILFLWWVYIYLRERIMSENIKPLLKYRPSCLLIFLQKFHWLNVKFLLSNPTKNEIWDYYFGKFKKINKQNISEEIKIKNKVLYKYWLKHSDFI